jgi:DHA2 family multidrug resistance protein-like MFS transporter
LLIAAVAFGMASAAAAMAPTAELLIVARVVQGVAGAGLMPPTLALLRTVFTDSRQRTRAVGIWSASGAGGAALGPTVAGLLLEHFYWGSVLLVNLPVVALIVGVGAWVLPEARSESDHPLDPLSVVYSTVGILGVVYGITELAHAGWRFWPAYPALVFGAALLWVFLRRQRRMPVPLLDIGLFREAKFSAAIVAQLLTVFANVGALFFIPIYLRQVSDFSPLQSGMALLPDSLVAMLTAPNTGRLIRWWGHRRVLLLGLGVGAAGLVLLLMMVGFSFALVNTSANDLVLTSASQDRVGAATGIAETAFELGNALGIAISGSLVSILYLVATGASANLTEAVDTGGFTTALTGTAIITGLLMVATTIGVARAVRSD